MFNISYDPQAKALYIYYKDIKPGGVSYTKEAAEEVNIDYDKDDNIIGVELLNIE